MIHRICSLTTAILILVIAIAWFAVCVLPKVAVLGIVYLHSWKMAVALATIATVGVIIFAECVAFIAHEIHYK